MLVDWWWGNIRKNLNNDGQEAIDLCSSTVPLLERVVKKWQSWFSVVQTKYTKPLSRVPHADYSFSKITNKFEEACSEYSHSVDGTKQLNVRMELPKCLFPLEQILGFHQKHL